MHKDFLPWQFWVLLLLAMLAWPIALNVWSFLKAGRATLEIKESKPRQGSLATSFWMSALALFAIAMLALFLLTPASDDVLRSLGRTFAGSTLLQVLACVGMSAFAFWETWRGWTTGSVEPISRGSLGPFLRVKQRKLYWASMGWNAIFGLGFVALAIGLIAS